MQVLEAFFRLGVIFKKFSGKILSELLKNSSSLCKISLEIPAKEPLQNPANADENVLFQVQSSPESGKLTWE